MAHPSDAKYRNRPAWLDRAMRAEGGPVSTPYVSDDDDAAGRNHLGFRMAVDDMGLGDQAAGEMQREDMQNASDISDAVPRRGRGRQTSKKDGD